MSKRSRKFARADLYALGHIQLQWGREQTLTEMVWIGGGSQYDEPLQWGREQTLTEIAESKRGASNSASLQWGREQTLTEIP